MHIYSKERTQYEIQISTRPTTILSNVPNIHNHTIYTKTALHTHFLYSFVYLRFSLDFGIKRKSILDCTHFDCFYRRIQLQFHYQLQRKVCVK